MPSMLRSCIQSMLKLVNSIIAMAGIAMVVYSLWMVRVWQKETGESIFDASDYPVPWFIYTFLGVGVTLCIISCSGHIGAETSNGCCLYLYMVFMFLLFVLEAVITADIFLNRHWEEDFPSDKTGNLDTLEKFVAENFDFCKWIGLSVVAAQVELQRCYPILQRKYLMQMREYRKLDDGLLSFLKNVLLPGMNLVFGISFLLAMILKALGSVQESYYDYDDDYYSSRLPLLRNSHNGPYVVGEPLYGARV